ncbi:MAG TPA: histidine phosphatase family protein [Elusimicrobiales bacterium]|nr:histidine phosphatase family protein [Elusimicrobiales bacterium]
MRELVLMRHGEALSVRESGAESDADRRLSPRGKDQASASAGRLKALGFVPDVIISSPLLRAVETADLAAAVFPSAVRLREPALASDASPEAILEALRSAAGEAPSVLVTGHQPAMGGMSGLLLNSPPPPFHTGSFAYFRLAEAAGRHAAELAEFFTPERI